ESREQERLASCECHVGSLLVFYRVRVSAGTTACTCRHSVSRVERDRNSTHAQPAVRRRGGPQPVCPEQPELLPDGPGEGATHVWVLGPVSYPGQGDERTGHVDEPVIQVRPPLVSDGHPAVAVQPADGPLDDVPAAVPPHPPAVVPPRPP